MARVRQVEIVEIPVEQLSYVPGRHDAHTIHPTHAGHTIHDAASGWLSRALVAVRQPHETGGMWPTTRSTGSTGPGTAGPAFWRVIDVAGSRLGGALAGWWGHERHDDGHLCLGEPHPVGDGWSLDGSFRVMAMSRRLPVELVLSPRFGPWTVLELIPRRAVHTNRTYFSVGHHCLDRFVATLHAYDDAEQDTVGSMRAVR